MKPPIEYRPKPKGGEANKTGSSDHSRNKTQPQAKVQIPSSGADFILIRRDRSKYNAYMRDYRKRQKLKKKP